MALRIPDSLQADLSQPVAVFGGGVSGQGVLALLRVLGVPGVVYDRHGTEFTTERARAHALAVFSPGFVPNHPWLVAACAAGLDCQGELDFASHFWRGSVVAVTGTNGKTTLTEFLTHALRQAGEPAHAAGNIGRTFSQLVAETAGGGERDIAVCEVSSFQAETMHHFRADATLWTNFAEDHLERHPGIEAYFSAKWNLAARTAEEGLWCGTSVQTFARKLNRDLPALAWVASEGQPGDPLLAGSIFAEYPQRENFILAAVWWRASGRSLDSLYAAAATFRPGRHRLARVGEHEDVTWWNDSKATNFHAVEAAVSRFDRPVFLIVGGRAKGGDLAGFVARLAPHVKHVFLIGETAPALAQACGPARVDCTRAESLAAAVRLAASAARPGDHVLLSPGFASFDMFRSYEDRGDQFERLVHELGTTANLG
ncbi:MAG: UDP-N-acetylmuramoyl-L-alanine--D-glutamate ligase [Opitutales bacterium]